MTPARTAHTLTPRAVQPSALPLLMPLASHRAAAGVQNSRRDPSIRAAFPPPWHHVYTARASLSCLRSASLTLASPGAYTRLARGIRTSRRRRMASRSDPLAIFCCFCFVFFAWPVRFRCAFFGRRTRVSLGKRKSFLTVEGQRAPGATTLQECATHETPWPRRRRSARTVPVAPSRDSVHKRRKRNDHCGDAKNAGKLPNDPLVLGCREHTLQGSSQLGIYVRCPLSAFHVSVAAGADWLHPDQWGYAKTKPQLLSPKTSTCWRWLTTGGQLLSIVHFRENTARKPKRSLSIGGSKRGREGGRRGEVSGALVQCPSGTHARQPGMNVMATYMSSPPEEIIMECQFISLFFVRVEGGREGRIKEMLINRCRNCTKQDFVKPEADIT